MNTWHHEVPEGRWTANALRLIPPGTPTFEGVIGRAYSVRLADRTIGTIRRHGTSGWMTKITGFEWRVVSEMGSARFGLKFTSVRMFPTSDTARGAVLHVLSSRPAVLEEPPSGLLDPKNPEFPENP